MNLPIVPDFVLSTFGNETAVMVRSKILADLGVILIESGRLTRISHVALVTDEKVARLYAVGACNSLNSAGLRVNFRTIPPGEGSKSLMELSRIYEWLAEIGFPRDGLILALGGGVVSDLAGFAAATWMRGVDFAICPTTLEAQIDACLGGKTAINIPGRGKNLVGVFHQPKVVLIDPETLATLELRDVRAGLAESVKHALIGSATFLSWHEQNVERILSLEPETVRELILKNLQFKANVVAKDANDKTGARAILNFGHTIGHAIEACCGYALRHGECVSLGLVAALRLSNKVIGLDATVCDRTEVLLERFGLPTRLPIPLSTDSILDAMHRDKKIEHGQIRFVLLEAIGRPTLSSDVPEPLIREILKSLIS